MCLTKPGYGWTGAVEGRGGPAPLQPLAAGTRFYDQAIKQEKGRKLRGAARLGREGYRSGGSELGSSAHTTSCACSRASALSTRRAARRGLPSARLGTCASSPRTRLWTWVKGTNVSGRGRWTSKGNPCQHCTHLHSEQPLGGVWLRLDSPNPNKGREACRILWVGVGMLTWSSNRWPRASRAEDRVSAVAWVPAYPASSRQAAVYTARSARVPSSQEYWEAERRERGTWSFGSPQAYLSYSP